MDYSQAQEPELEPLLDFEPEFISKLEFEQEPQLEWKRKQKSGLELSHEASLDPKFGGHDAGMTLIQLIKTNALQRH